MTAAPSEMTQASSSSCHAIYGGSQGIMGLTVPRSSQTLVVIGGIAALLSLVHSLVNSFLQVPSAYALVLNTAPRCILGFHKAPQSNMAASTTWLYVYKHTHRSLCLLHILFPLIRSSAAVNGKW